MERPFLHQPIPRRTFEITPASTDSSSPPSPANEVQNPELLMKTRSNNSPPPSRTRSILNLTSSTLLGIYSGATDGAQQELNTPWGTGAQTPARSHKSSLDAGRLRDRLQVPVFPFTDGSSKRPMILRTPKRTVRNYYLPLFFQTIMLFGFGMGFGSLLTHMHDTQQITPIPVPQNTTSSYYQIAWGLMGVIIGNALPQLDVFFESEEAIADGYDSKPKEYQHVRTASSSSRSEKEPSLADSGLGPIWHSAVRSVGAFMGIAFALRRIPWQSTLQVSLTLAVADPILWYIIDRSKPGLALSSTISVAGTLLSLVFNPQFVPVPGIHQEQTSEKVGAYVWLASILFCTSLCFGAIGRRLQL